ncbi:MAG: filamentous hemagglutinin N-terminal domain-containing protein [Candidatus Gastranaerophilales bacterium]|nr:filamentous hemagglutinin N-terminal domain-containing protein [Candidatus Gastranaerophilales bacterium]
MRKLLFSLRKVIASMLLLSFANFSLPALAATEIFQGGKDNFGAQVNDFGGANLNKNNNNNAQIGITGSGNTIIWDWLNVGAGKTLDFNFLNNGQVALNKVIGGSMSKFAGTLSTSGADGHLVISNPSGMLFMNGAIVNANSLTLTTHDATLDADKLTLDGTSSVNSQGIKIGGLGESTNAVVMRIANDLNIISNGIKIENADILAGNNVNLITADGVNFYAKSNKIPNITKSTNINALAFNAFNNNNKNITSSILVKDSAIAVKNNNTGKIYLVAKGNNSNIAVIDSAIDSKVAMEVTGDATFEVIGNLDLSGIDKGKHTSKVGGNLIAKTIDKTLNLKNNTTTWTTTTDFNNVQTATSYSGKGLINIANVVVQGDVTVDGAGVRLYNLAANNGKVTVNSTKDTVATASRSTVEKDYSITTQDSLVSSNTTNTASSSTTSNDFLHKSDAITKNMVNAGDILIDNTDSALSNVDAANKGEKFNSLKATADNNITITKLAVNNKSDLSAKNNININYLTSSGEVKTNSIRKTSIKNSDAVSILASAAELNVENVDVASKLQSKTSGNTTIKNLNKNKNSQNSSLKAEASNGNILVENITVAHDVDLDANNITWGGASSIIGGTVDLFAHQTIDISNLNIAGDLKMSAFSGADKYGKGVDVSNLVAKNITLNSKSAVVNFSNVTADSLTASAGWQFTLKNFDIKSAVITMTASKSYSGFDSRRNVTISELKNNNDMSLKVYDAHNITLSNVNIKDGKLNATGDITTGGYLVNTTGIADGSIFANHKTITNSTLTAGEIHANAAIVDKSYLTATKRNIYIGKGGQKSAVVSNSSLNAKNDISASGSSFENSNLVAGNDSKLQDTNLNKVSSKTAKIAFIGGADISNGSSVSAKSIAGFDGNRVDKVTNGIKLSNSSLETTENGINLTNAQFSGANIITSAGDIILDAAKASNLKSLDLTAKSDVELKNKTVLNNVKAAASNIILSDSNVGASELNAKDGKILILKDTFFHSGSVANAKDIQADHSYVKGSTINSTNFVSQNDNYIKENSIVNAKENLEIKNNSHIENSTLNSDNKVVIKKSSIKGKNQINAGTVDINNLDSWSLDTDIAIKSTNDTIIDKIATGNVNIESTDGNILIKNSTVRKNLKTKSNGIAIDDSSINGSAIIDAVGAVVINSSVLSDTNIATTGDITIKGVKTNGDLTITKADNVFISNSDKPAKTTDITIADLATGKTPINDYNDKKFTTSSFETIGLPFGNQYGDGAQITLIGGNLNISNANSVNVVNTTVIGDYMVKNITADANLITSYIGGSYAPVRETISGDANAYLSYIGSYSPYYVIPEVLSYSLDDVNRLKFGSDIDTIFRRQFSPRGFAAADDEIKSRIYQTVSTAKQGASNSIKLTKPFIAN